MMTTTRKMLGLTLGVALLGGGGIATAQAQDGADASPSAASADLTTALQLAREEERVARDLYKVLADTYNGAVPFSRITLSEQRHYEAIGVLLQRHHVTDPSAGKAAGTYADPTLQTNYNTWLAQGKVSLDKAYDVGVAVEKADIADLKSSINTVTEADVRQVLTHLLNASQHHLTAYQEAANGNPVGPGQGMQQRMKQGANTGNEADNQRPRMGNAPGAGMSNRGPGRGPGTGSGQPSSDCPLTDTDTT
jgi:hypothetical protein